MLTCYPIKLSLKSEQHISYSLCLTLKLPVSSAKLPITIANSLDPDQDLQNVGPDLIWIQNVLHLDGMSVRMF